MEHKKGLQKIWILFGVFLILFIINLGFISDIGQTAQIWLILDVYVTILSVIMLIRNNFPNKKQFFISLILGILVFIAYQGMSFTSIKTFIVTILCSLASFSIFNKYVNNSLKVLKSTSVKSISVSVIIGLIVGVIWGIINIFLNSEVPILNITLSCFITALSPAIYEEIALRTLLFAVCLYLLKGEITTKKEKFSCYFFMIIPHVMIHTPEQFSTYGLITGIISILIFALVFGLPFAILQRKRDITSAMIAHGTVDVIRFCLFGTPF